MSSKLTTQEAVMGQVIPKQHPSVVLRSHFRAIRALLAVALVAICALATALVIVSDDADNVATVAPKSTPQQQALPAGTRFDGGPDEGTRGPQSYWESSEPRSSYQPAQADGSKARAGGPTFIPMGPSH
jgi:hypothetical protein